MKFLPIPEEKGRLQTIVEQFKKRTRTYRVRQVGRLYATQLYERVTLFLKLFRYKGRFKIESAFLLKHGAGMTMLLRATPQHLTQLNPLLIQLNELVNQRIEVTFFE